MKWMNLEPIIQSKVNQKEKNKHRKTCLQDSNKDTDAENRFVGTVGKGEGGTDGESSSETYTLPYVKQMTSGDLVYDSGCSNQGSVSA